MKITQFLMVSLLAVFTTEIQGKTIRVYHGINGQHGALSRAAGKAKVTRLQGRRTALKLKTVHSCPKGFAQFKDSCFKQVQVPETWQSARRACKRAGPGGDLASINSKEELDFIQNKFGGGEGELRWIGLHKESPGTPYKWVNGDTVQHLPWVSNYTGHEPTDDVALSLTKLHFLPKTDTHELLPFLCGTRKVPGKSSTEGVGNANLAMGELKDVSEGEMSTRKDQARSLYTCREGWESFEGKCYKDFNEKRTHKDATAICKKVGAYLMSLHGPRESEFVRTQVMKNNRYDEFYWLGLTNDKNGLRWSDRSPFDYSNWLPGTSVTAQDKGSEADVDGNRDHLEKCFQIDSDEFMWEEEDCDEFCYFVCIQIEVTDPIDPPTTPRLSTAQPTRQTTYLANDMWDKLNKAIDDLTVVVSAPKASSINTRLDTDKLKDIQIWDKQTQSSDKANAPVPTPNSSSINKRLNANVHKENLKSASTDSESEGDSDQKEAIILVVLIGSVVLVVAAFGAISWRRQYGSFPFPWTSLHNSSSHENHKLQSLRQSLRDPDTSGPNQQGIYGATSP